MCIHYLSRYCEENSQNDRETRNPKIIFASIVFVALHRYFVDCDFEHHGAISRDLLPAIQRNNMVALFIVIVHRRFRFDYG